MTSDDPKIAKVLTNFETLSAVSTSLNAASDELTKVVGTLDEALKKLNLGLTVWVAFRFREHPDLSEYDRDQIGHAKVMGTWGLALRHVWGDPERDDHNEDGPWLFKDAPRQMRIDCLDAIPELIEALAKTATDTTKSVQEKTKQVRELASAVEKAASESKATALHLSYKLAPTPTMKLSDLAGKGKEGGK